MRTPMRCALARRAVAIAAALSLSIAATPASADAGGWFSKNFIDGEDGAFDVSEWLSKGGFFPVPIIVTEPAVDNGLGLAAVFIQGGDPAANIPPDVTGAAGVVTGNDSKLAGVFHQGAYLGGDLRYLGALGAADVNLDFFGRTGRGIGFNVDGAFTLQNLRHRIYDSDVFLGARWLYLDSTISFDGIPALGLEPSFDTRLSGLGPTLYYDSRDNIFTPTEGVNARVAFTVNDEAWGSDYDYSQLDASALMFHTPAEDWHLGLKAELSAVSGQAPFFAEPFISLRGIPALRFQGESVISTEFEARRMISDRWSLLGFAGVGFAGDEGFSDLDALGPQGAFGGGFRYLIARKLGLHVGIDVAQGPEEQAFYIQFGHAWQRE